MNKNNCIVLDYCRAIQGWMQCMWLSVSRKLFWSIKEPPDGDRFSHQQDHILLTAEFDFLCNVAYRISCAGCRRVATSVQSPPAGCWPARRVAAAVAAPGSAAAGRTPSPAGNAAEISQETAEAYVHASWQKFSGVWVVPWGPPAAAAAAAAAGGRRRGSARRGRPPAGSARPAAP